MELAKQAGIQFLRIHIKADEPRRLYWADKLGMLIMQDMPSASFQNPDKRSAWEETMRATIARDRNHPSIFAWVAFNETWGLSYFHNSKPLYPQNPDTQQWVEGVWKEMKQLDPSRLVEDNSADKRDHVASDINSWHFYIDNYERAKANIDNVVSKTFPGSEFNFVKGRKQETAPLINSEYGAVGAGNGDRDVSWGFHFLTNELRLHEKIQGYIYTELTDIEWEHNGFYNYDRSAKEFGYDAFVPGMTTRDLQGEDFVGYDGPPMVKATAFTLPIFVSHFSARTGQPTLRWWLTGTDDFGAAVTTPPQTQPVKWERARVTSDIHLDVRVPGSRPFTGALALELLDSSGKRIAANFVNVATRSAMSPRIEVLNPRTVALRFSPIEVREQGPDSGTHPGKFWAGRQSYVSYRVLLPDWVIAAEPEKIDLLAEMATHAGTAKLDWPWRQKAVDYPQTDVHKYPGKARVSIFGVDAGEVALADDPADIRGFLSSVANFPSRQLRLPDPHRRTGSEGSDGPDHPNLRPQRHFDLRRRHGPLRLRPGRDRAYGEGCESGEVSWESSPCSSLPRQPVKNPCTPDEIEPPNNSAVRPGDTLAVTSRTANNYANLLLPGGESLNIVQELTAPLIGSRGRCRGSLRSRLLRGPSNPDAMHS